MNILISGASGLVGSALQPALTGSGHTVARLSRDGEGPDRLPWDPSTGVRDPRAMEGFDAVVHLAGENIAQGRWTRAKKRRIRDSRVLGTRSLCASIVSLAQPPPILLCASAIGFYGDRGDTLLDESALAGTGFLPDVCREWEAAARPAEDRSIRVVHLRFGVILSRHGGALAKMLTPFRLGLGGRLGDGRQYMSWIGIDDAVGIIEFALRHESLNGPVNTVSPEPATNREFTATLARVVSRPAIFPMPAFAARIAFGEMADALLLASTRVVPARLEAAGYRFRHPGLEGALRHLIGVD